MNTINSSCCLERRHSDGDFIEPVKQPITDNHHTTNRQLTSVRFINTLPLNCIENYSPYFSLEFDIAVQEYCRNRHNHILHKSQHSTGCTTVNKSASQQINRLSGKLLSFSGHTNHQQQANQKQTINEYTSINAPFNKIVRNCKVVVSGDVAVGKTCLVNRFGRDIYSSSYQTTIGVDFDLQRFNILGQPYVLQIWDTAGLERFKCITSSYYRGCQVALLVFDMSNMSTLANVLRWKDEVLVSSKSFDQLANESSRQLTKQQRSEQPLLFLVGTKSDLLVNEASRAFIKEQANKIAALIKAELWFVSAQTGENVNELFSRVAALSFQRCIQDEIQRIRFETSTLGACLKEKLVQHQKELWLQSSKLIKITKKKDGDDRRSRCINIQCVIK